jgi:hypothetical protein
MTARISLRAVLISVVAPAFGLGTVAAAEPLLTVSCEKPNGFSIAYGVDFTQRLDAEMRNQPEPKPSLREVTRDGYAGKPSFIIDSNQKKMAIVWGELPEDAELRKKAKEMGLPQLPVTPATEAVIVQFFDEQISAVLVNPWSITTYSLFPRKDAAFISQQSLDMGLKNAIQIAAYARCDFSWAVPQRK